MWKAAFFFILAVTSAESVNISWTEIAFHSIKEIVILFYRLQQKAALGSRTHVAVPLIIQTEWTWQFAIRICALRQLQPCSLYVGGSCQLSHISTPRQSCCTMQICQQSVWSPIQGQTNPLNRVLCCSTTAPHGRITAVSWQILYI
jgi:hypothetical protein